MTKFATALAIVGFIGWGSSPPAQPQGCLHGTPETAAQAARRKAALAFARQVNTFEHAGNQQAMRFYALSDLPGLPSLPDGFQARLTTDGGAYAFSVKDTADPCHFAYFSDEDGLIYNATPIQ